MQEPEYKWRRGLSLSRGVVLVMHNSYRFSLRCCFSFSHCCDSNWRAMLIVCDKWLYRRARQLFSEHHLEKENLNNYFWKEKERNWKWNYWLNRKCLTGVAQRVKQLLAKVRHRAKLKKDHSTVSIALDTHIAFWRGTASYTTYNILIWIIHTMYDSIYLFYIELQNLHALLIHATFTITLIYL